MIAICKTCNHDYWYWGVTNAHQCAKCRNKKEVSGSPEKEKKKF